MMTTPSQPSIEGSHRVGRRRQSDSHQLFRGRRVVRRHGNACEEFLNLFML
jgi:hypothetical protein